MMEKVLCHRIVPSRVDGSAEVLEAFVYPDRLKLIGKSQCSIIKFADIARWPWPKWFWRAMFAFGVRPRWLPVADRDWFHAPRDRFYRFYTSPALTLYMPVDETADDYARTHFVQIRQVIHTAGFHTNDLG
jgi:hypothetical protein